jgi:hypothetical protein
MSSHHWSRALNGWLAGCGAATAVLGVFTLILMGIASDGDVTILVGGVTAAIIPLLLTFLVICLLTGTPAAIVIWVSEKFRIRAITFFGSAGAAIGTVSVELLRQGLGPRWPAGVNLLFAIAGLAAGLVYWHIAGKYAGGDRVSAGCPGMMERFNWRRR